jgi:hypothetical protein
MPPYMVFLLVTFGLPIHKNPDKDHIYPVSYTVHLFTFLTMWGFEVLLIVLVFITTVPHSRCPGPSLYGVLIGHVTCNVQIVDQAIVIWNIQQFDTCPVLCDLGKGNFVVFCAAQNTTCSSTCLLFTDFFAV